MSREHPRRNNVGLPPRPFLYTLDQVAALLGMTEENLRLRYLFYEGRSHGRRPPRLLKVVNIATNDHKAADWRCTEQELIRWMRARGIKYHERGWVE